MFSFNLSYETVKYVSIRDARLGILRWVLLVAILTYVIVVELLQQGGYLQSSAVVGVTRFSLQQPTTNQCDPSQANCTNDFVPLDHLPYCRQHKHSGNEVSYPGPTYPCQIYEAVNAQEVRETSLVVWTRSTLYNQTLVCDESHEMTCPQTYQNQDMTGTSGPFYIAQAEAFTVLLEHAVTASSICAKHSTNIHTESNKNVKPHYSCSAQAKDYQGRLRSTNPQLCHEEYLQNNSYASAWSDHLRATAPCFIGPNRTLKQQDYFSLSVLLRAAGHTLDDCVNAGNAGKLSSIHSDQACEETLRSSGATLLVKVHWNDAMPYRGIVKPHYSYTPQLIGTSYKESQAFYYEPYRQSRILMQAHGLKVAVLLEGTFHQFQMLNFLITLTTALGLLAVARTVVDQLLYVLPDMERYQEAKYESLVPNPTQATTIRNPPLGTPDDALPLQLSHDLSGDQGEIGGPSLDSHLEEPLLSGSQS